MVDDFSTKYITAATATVLVSAYFYNYSLNIERPKGIYYRESNPVFNLIRLIRNMSSIHELQTSLYEKVDVLTFTSPVAGRPRMISTIDPKNIEYFLKDNFGNYLKGPALHNSLLELLGNGIFNSNGEKWRYQRKAASHIFNVRNFRDEFTDVFVHEMHIMCNSILEKCVDESKVVDFHDLMYKFTLDSFVRIGFGIQLDSMFKKEKVPFAVSFDYLQSLGSVRIINPFKSTQEKIIRLFAPWKVTSLDHVKVIDSFAAEVINKRRKEIKDGISGHKDLLSRFMTATNENGELLNDTELRDTILNFIIAGRDTTAQALSWLFYNLCLHPRIEAKVFDEIKDSINNEDENNSQRLYEIMSDMPYLHAVFYETLRLYPSVPANQKYALNDDVWPDGSVIKAGYYIGWSPYALGRSFKIWGQNAKEFYPERWLDSEGKLRRESASRWPAFHVGPRICLGQNLATLEALICITMLLRRYKFKLVPGQEITYDISLTLPMKYGMRLYVEKR